MIDEQHPMQIGMFPMDMKCHTPQQLQQLQQQQQTSMLMSGNERMLASSTAVVATAAAAAVMAAGGGAGMGAGAGPTTAATTTTAAVMVNGNCDAAPTAMTANGELLCGKSGSGNAQASTTPPTTAIVNGICNNHNNSNTQGQNNSNNNNNINSHSSSNNTSGGGNTNKSHNINNIGAGPGPPTHGMLNVNNNNKSNNSSNGISGDISTTNVLTSASGRVTLSECNLNGGCNSVNGCIGIEGLCSHSHNNGSNCTLPMQHHLQHNHHQQQQQHQHQHHHNHHNNHHHQHLNSNLHHQHAQQQQQIHLLGPAMLHSHGASVMLANTSASVIGGDPALALACSSGGGLGGHMAQCGFCCQPICDRYIMRVVDTSFHEGCLKCCTCSLHLVHSCFARDGKLYCRIDYERLFIRNRCLGCGHKIASDELVMRTLENVFHLKCFACVVCGALLKKGEQYVVKQGQLFCRFDYEKEVEMMQGYDFYGDDLFPPKLDGRRGPKRPRTILNTQQRRAFKASFEVSPKPCRKVRENLAKETGLSLRIVQVWFQNQRAKVKKIQKKAKAEHHAKGTSDSQDSQESDSSLAKVKDEAHSDSESLLESPFSSCGAGGGSSSDGVAKLRCIKDENENAPFNCMDTNKENCNKTNEPILNTILGLSYTTFQQLMGPFTQSPMINPIDRLYSMQNSYFRPEELSYADCGKEVADN